MKVVKQNLLGTKITKTLEGSNLDILAYHYPAEDVLVIHDLSNRHDDENYLFSLAKEPYGVVLRIHELAENTFTSPVRDLFQRIEDLLVKEDLIHELEVVLTR